MAVFMPTTLPAISTSGPPELPGLMAASVWMKRWNWLLATPPGPGASSMERSLPDMIPAEGVSDGEDPIAYLCAGRVAELDGGQRLLGVDLDDGDVGVGIDADYCGGT